MVYESETVNYSYYVTELWRGRWWLPRKEIQRRTSCAWVASGGRVVIPTRLMLGPLVM
jgi:hypothetical protein